MKKSSALLAVVLAVGFTAAATGAYAFGNMTRSGEGKEEKAPVDKTPVEKAKEPDSYTVGEIFSKGAELDGKKVVVRGRVMKVSKNIMKMNWIHLYDGSGDAEKRTNDLVATSQHLPSVGEVVTVSGILSKDKDFGAGYKFPVIIEEAVLLLAP